MVPANPCLEPEAGARTLCAMKLRVYLTGPQTGRLGHWIHCAHRFRNEATAWLHAWRVERATWFSQHPEAQGLKGEALKALLPPRLAANPVNTCSAWLTGRLQQARARAPLELGLGAEERSMRGLAEAVGSRLRHLTRREREELTDAWLLTVPRTVFDQVLQDLKKSWAKALKDRAGKIRKSAGFPRPRKFRYASSVRIQLSAEKNQAVRDHWDRGEIFVPGLGKLSFRDSGYVLPKTAPSLFTLGRDAAGRAHATFVCVEGEGPWVGEGTSKRRARLERKRAREGGAGFVSAPTPAPASTSPDLGKGLRRELKILGSRSKTPAPDHGKPTWALLPLDPATGLPTIDAIDLGLTDRTVTASGQKSGRVRHLKRYAHRLRRLSRKLARQQHGSRRWQKTKRDIGRTHTKVVSQRDALLTEQAQALVKDNAILCLETLFLGFLMQNRHLAKSAADAALGKFQKILEAEAAKRGHLILRCDRFDASSKTCSVCKTKNPDLKLRHRSWICKACGTHHDRDVNAATNVQEMALERAISSLSTVPESGIGTRLPTGLHPDLAAFVARGGLTALRGHRPCERRAAEACVLPQTTPVGPSGTGQPR